VVKKERTALNSRPELLSIFLNFKPDLTDFVLEK
jgi:hypothetical protein